MQKIFDKNTRKLLLSRWEDFVVSFITKWCAGNKVSIAIATDEYFDMNLDCIREGQEGDTPLCLWIAPEDTHLLENARMTIVPKWTGETVIYTSHKVSKRCGCGSSFAVEWRENTAHKHEEENQQKKIASKLAAIKGNFLKKSESRERIIYLSQEGSIDNHEWIFSLHQDQKLVIIDDLEGANTNISLSGMGSLEYYLLLIDSPSKQSHIRSLGDSQSLSTHLLVSESYDPSKTQKKNHELIIEVEGSNTKIASKSLTLSSSPILTRVLSGIRILTWSGHEATLSQRSILLSEGAAIAQIPLLDVHTNDTKASHSANIVSITPEETFYMMSRGISDEDAKDIKIVSLIREIVHQQHLTQEDIQDLLIKHQSSYSVL